jgi:excisionase family DNA binding protein
MGKQQQEDRILLTKTEAASALGFGVRWLEKQIEAGAPYVRIGRSVRLRRKDVEAFARDGRWPARKEP